MSWTAVPSERGMLYSQIGLRLVDEFTGRRPSYPILTELEYQDSSGDWQPVQRQPTVTPSGVLSFPGLGRSTHVGSAPTVRYRVVVQSDSLRPEYYRPEYL
ncbi:MAG: hypothetical protein ACR2RB_15420, partial [Gammaproteobacteria bacterium]